MRRERMKALLLAPTLLFLSCLSVGLTQDPGSTSDVNDGYPPFWEEISGDIADFPVKDNKTIINIWNFRDRLKICKILTTKSHKYFVQFGQNDEGNVLWVFTSFYGKLYKSARFSDPSDPSICGYDAGSPGCVSFHSGWAGITGSVITMFLLGAVETGFLDDASYEIEFLAPEEHKSDFCYSVEECRASHPQTMDIVARFYQYLLSRKVSSVVNDIPVYDTDKETVITYMWDAHKALVDVATPKFSDISQYLSKTERDFTLDFLLAVEFCQAARYRLFLPSVAEFLVGFPHRLLTDQDDPFLTQDFSMREKAQLSVVKLISIINKITGGEFLTIWNKYMDASERNQFLGRFLIKRLLLIPIS